jgi:hypothetical protein
LHFPVSHKNHGYTASSLRGKRKPKFNEIQSKIGIQGIKEAKNCSSKRLINSINP